MSDQTEIQAITQRFSRLLAIEAAAKKVVARAIKGEVQDDFDMAELIYEVCNHMWACNLSEPYAICIKCGMEKRD